jgi:hypothetical protein
MSIVINNKRKKVDYPIQHNSETLHTSNKGAINELKVCAWFLEKGYEVFRNVSPIGKGDIIIWKKGEPPKVIDVKCTRNYITSKGELSQKAGATSKTKGVYTVFIKNDGEVYFSD